jgi:hypothetical protein
MSRPRNREPPALGATGGAACTGTMAVSVSAAAAAAPPEDDALEGVPTVAAVALLYTLRLPGRPGFGRVVSIYPSSTAKQVCVLIDDQSYKL